ncbi:MAG: hypothetical protein NWF07_08870 [Candidatus Bathyarchaeota archaeon]|nr:hypothetical protein [Candidatus Bathyarchaeota archaeon]
MAKQKKVPSFKQNPSPTKTVKFVERPEQILDSRISWQFNLMDSDGPWKSLPKQLNKHIKTIHAYEKQTIGQIFHEQHEYNHSIPIGKLIPRAQKRLKDLHINVEILHRLRLGGRPRLWGILEGNIFQILWVDPSHQVCPSKKKHT